MPTSPLSPSIETALLPIGETAATCAPCADRLTASVRALPGVRDARVDTSSSRLTVDFDPAQVSNVVLAKQAAQTERDLAARFRHQVFAVAGMDCPGCALTLESTVKKMPGVLSASCQFTSSTLHVEHDPAAFTETTGEAVQTRAQRLGFTLRDTSGASRQNGDAHEHDHAGEKGGLWKRLGGRVGASALLLVLGLVLEHAIKAPDWAVKVALGASILLGGGRFALAGLSALRARVLGTNLLMALAAVGAMFIGHWEEAATVVVLYTIGEALEGAAMDKTRQALESLIGAQPQTATVERANGQTETIQASALRVGDVLIVAPGQAVAADGTIVSGTSAINEAAITGESLPRDKATGDAVYAGSLNGNGPLRVRVDALPENSTLSRVLRLTERAQAEKAPTQTVVERFGRIYTPLVLGAAIVLMAFGPFVFPGINWVYRALTLLVVACPCALLIATPVAYVSALARAARAGVLVKGGAHLENLAQAQTVFLDKTGTLTTGDLRVSDVWAATPSDETAFVRRVAQIERQSEHPVARAVVVYADAKETRPTEHEHSHEHGPECQHAHHDDHSHDGHGCEHDHQEHADDGDLQAIPGRGIAANGGAFLIGNRALLAERSVPLAAEAEATVAAWENDGKTVLIASENGVVTGAIAVFDMLRPEASDALTALRETGKQTVILTGDNERAAQNVAREVNAGAFHAALLPQQKQQIVREATEGSTKTGTVFVGDGINDAPALASASVGVSLGKTGTALALETADVVLMDGTLHRLPWVFHLARATRGIVRWNVGIAVGAACVLLVAAATGKMTLGLGVLGHEGTALLVIANGVRLLWQRD